MICPHCDYVYNEFNFEKDKNIQGTKGAFYSSYPQHKPGIVTSESSSDYSDFFDSLCRLNRVHHSLIVD